MEYDVVICDFLYQLTEKVNRLVKEGWHPLGGVAVLVDDDVVKFLQAVIKVDVVANYDDIKKSNLEIPG